MTSPKRIAILTNLIAVARFSNIADFVIDFSATSPSPSVWLCFVGAAGKDERAGCRIEMQPRLGTGQEIW